MEHNQNSRGLTQTLVSGFVVGGTLGTTLSLMLLTYQWGHIRLGYSTFGWALMMGFLSALVTDVCSWKGRNSLDKTVFWTALSGLILFLGMALKYWLEGRPMTTQVAIFDLGLVAILTICSGVATGLAPYFSTGRTTRKQI